MAGGNDPILLTGGTGFVGRAVLAALRANHPEMTVRCLVRRRGAIVPQPGIEVITGDLSKEQELERGVAGCASVLHFAGTTHAIDPQVYARVNEEGTARLVRAAEQAGVKRFVFASSRAVEEHGGAYAASKRRAETVVRTSRLRFVILRFAEVYGPGFSEGIGALVRLVRRFAVIPTIPEARLAPVDVEDVAQAVLASLQSPAAERGTYTIAGPRSYTFEEGVRIIAASLGLRRITVPLPLSVVRGLATHGWMLKWFGLAGDQLTRLLCQKDDNIEPARQQLGFAPRNFEEGLKRLVGSVAVAR